MSTGNSPQVLSLTATIVSGASGTISNQVVMRVGGWGNASASATLSNAGAILVGAPTLTGTVSAYSYLTLGASSIQSGTWGINDQSGLNWTMGGSLTGGSFIPTSSTVPTNGMYLSASNVLAFATNSTPALTISSAQTLAGIWGTIPQTALVGNSGSTNNSSSGSGAFVNMTPSYSIPANALTSGRAMRITVSLIFTTGAAAPSFNMQLLAGAVVLGQTIAIVPASNMSGHTWVTQFIIQALGAPSASTNVTCGIIQQLNSISNASSGLSTNQPNAVATNSGITLQVSTQWATAGTGTNTVSIDQLIVEYLNY